MKFRDFYVPFQEFRPIWPNGHNGGAKSDQKSTKLYFTMHFYSIRKCQKDTKFMKIQSKVVKIDYFTQPITKIAQKSDKIDYFDHFDTTI